MGAENAVQEETQQKTRLRQANDAELTRRTREGCREAFNKLARRYRMGVYLTARQILGASGQAEDVAQDALITAFRALPTLADPERFGAWLGSITRHRAQRVARQERRYVPLEPAHLDHLQASIAPVPEELTEAFGTLGEDYQTVLHLRYWKEWSVGQIAAFLSLPITTIKWQLHYGRETLRHRLSRLLEETEEKDEEHGKFCV